LVILDASPYFGGRSGGATEKGIDPQKIIADLGNYAKRLSATLLIVDPITPLDPAERRHQPEPGSSPFADSIDSIATQYNQPAYRTICRKEPRPAPAASSSFSLPESFCSRSARSTASTSALWR
jgi:hypothetical protein